MRSQSKSEPKPPKEITFPTDFESLMWNAVLYLTVAVVGAVLMRGF